MKTEYATKQLAKLAGVSVRTLHLYDKQGLLKPSTRTTAGYRRYGEQELLRLQQILFYKELNFTLKDIRLILDNPDFDLIKALESHKAALTAQRERLDTLLNTINNTVIHLKNKTTMNNYEELYEGLPKEQALAWRKEAIEKWGEETVTQTEKALLEMPFKNLEQLKADQKDIAAQLRFKFLAGEKAESAIVQEQVARHYLNICGFWGITNPADMKPERYKGLAELYVTDDRYMAVNGKPDPDFTQFMRSAMVFFADSTHL